MPGAHRTQTRNDFFLAGALALGFAFWLGSSDLYAQWEGVPPVPTKEGAMMMALGDAQFAYRLGAITLQNLGDGGGRVTPISNYEFDKLGAWFRLLDGLDPASDHVPMLAAYYFGGSRAPKDVAVVVDYLARIGENPVGSKWRWLAQAIFLARHRLNNLDLALDLSYRLSRMELVDDTMPAWGRNMPAFVLSEKGDREDARKMVENLLYSSRGFHPNEVNFMAAYLVETLGVDQKEVDAILKMRGKELDEGYRRPLPAPAPE